MIRIEITAAAYAALAATATRSLLDARRSPQGGFYIWKLKASRRPGEDDGDAILRIALEGFDAT
jgi:hypothetical protein